MTNRCGSWSQVAVLIGLLFVPMAMVSAETLRAGGSGSTSAVVRVLADAFNKKHPADEVQVVTALGTPGGLKALKAKVVDVALASRPIREDEIKDGGLTVHEIARTPFVMAVPSSNGLNDLTLGALVQFLEKPDATWPDGTRARMVLRPKDDVDTLLIQSFSPAVAQAMQTALARPGAFVAATDYDAIAAIQRLPGAIGGTTLGQILADKRPLKALTLAGKAGTVEGIKSGAYPYLKRHFLAVRADASPVAQRFVAFARSADGQRVLESVGCWTGPFDAHRAVKD